MVVEQSVGDAFKLPPDSWEGLKARFTIRQIGQFVRLSVLAIITLFD